MGNRLPESPPTTVREYENRSFEAAMSIKAGPALAGCAGQGTVPPPPPVSARSNPTGAAGHGRSGLQHSTTRPLTVRHHGSHVLRRVRPTPTGRPQSHARHRPGRRLDPRP